MHPFFPIILALCQVGSAYAAEYTWNIGWVNRNPDTLHSRPVIGINGQWPPPTLNVNVGEQVTINLVNNLGNETTSLHFHGLFQNGTNSMDGPVGLVQCPVGPGETFTQVFQVNQPGTYWYHSHDRGQYPDGFRGPLIVHDPSNPYASQIDDELVLSMSDWYHKEMPDLIPGFLSTKLNPEGSEPVPDSAILNDNLTTSFNLKPGKTYMVRMINFSNFASFFVTYDQHEMTIIEVDGVYTKPAKTDLVYLADGQRMSVLITAKATAAENYAFVGAMDPSMFNSLPNSLIPYLNATGYLIYNNAKPLPKSAPTFNSYGGAFDDFDLVPYDMTPLFKPVTKRLTFNVNSGNSEAIYYNQNRFSINNSTYVEPKVPTLYSVLSTGSAATNVEIYGPASNSYIVDYHDVVEVVVNNFDSGGHPIHMHGHNFQMVQRSGVGAGVYSGTPNNPPATPIRRDVMKVNQGGYLVYRFRADNPDKSPPRHPILDISSYQPLLTSSVRVWAFHCHIDWHLIAGFFATIIEAPLQIQKQTVPRDQYQVCKDQNLPYQGNAAANTQNYTDLKGAYDRPPPIQDQGATLNSY